jgi:hypothetical protein
MLKLIGGVIVGLVVGVGTMIIVQLIGNQIYPTGEVDMRDREAVAAMIAALPTGGLLFVAAAWFIGALAGATVAYRISGRRGAAWTIGVLIAAAGILNVFMYPHPVWMQVAAVVAPLLGAWVASRLTPAPEPAALRTDAP